MKAILKKLTTFLSTAAMLLAGMASSSMPAYALENGIYTATSTPYYAHPYTGVIEDSGGESSSVLGQSMTESALHTQALIEVDPDGNMYATVRLYLMDNIENPQFMVQDDPYGRFYNVSADIMMENYDVNTTDFRFQIPNENCIVRSTFYVVPMGRDVIFYIGFSNLAEGSSDFVTRVEVVEVTEPLQTEAPVEEQTEGTSTTTTAITATATTTAVTTTVTTTKTTAVSIESIQAETYEAVGIVMFDENGNMIEEAYAETEPKENEDEEVSIVPIVIITAVAGIAFGGGAVFFISRKRGSK